MKLIIAVVRPFILDRLIAAFEEIPNFPGMTVIDSAGLGQRLLTDSDAINPLKPNTRIEIAVSDEMVDTVVAAIKGRAHTGKKGDGIVLVLPLADLVMI